MSREKYHLNASFQAIGAFWPHGQSNERFTGTLSSEKGKLALTAAPIYSTDDFHSELARMFGAVGRHQRVERTKSLCGFTSEGECSLLSVALINEGGLIDLSSGQIIAENQYRVWAAVMGLHLESAEAAAIESATLTFDNISEWFPPAFGVTCEAEQVSITTRATPLEVFRFPCAALDSELICRVHTQAPMKRRRAKVKSTPVITIQPTMRQSVEWFIQVAMRIENFLTLCLGTSVNTKTVRFLADEKSGWFIQNVNRRIEKANSGSWIRCPQEMTATALDRWLSETEDNRPVEKTLLGVLRKSSMFAETAFLSLTQALEGFGRIKCGNRRRTFKQSVEDTCDMLSPEFAERLLGDKNVFALRVVQTRNYYTHLGIPARSEVVTDGGELFHLNQRLHALLRCVMLLRLGIDESFLREPIQYQATRWSLL